MKTKRHARRLCTVWLLVIAMLCAVVASSALVASAADNDGWKDDSTNKTLTATITTADEFADLVDFCASNSNSGYTYDIALGANIILYAEDTITSSFVGTFDGKGYTITLTGVAPFGTVGSTSTATTIQNVKLDGYVTVDNNDTSVGALACEVTNTAILNCSNAATITDESGYATNVGGLVGVASDSTLTDCTNTGAVNCASVTYVGGLVASVSGSFTMSGCINEGAIAGEIVGGLVGYLDSSEASITSSSNTGAVAGTNAAGLVACLSDNTNATLSNLANTGAISGVSLAGGMIAQAGSATYSMSSVTSADTVSAGSNGTASNGVASENTDISITSAWQQGTLYTLLTGMTKIAKVATDGTQTTDGCVYTSGVTFYVAESGNYSYVS